MTTRTDGQANSVFTISCMRNIYRDENSAHHLGLWRYFVEGGVKDRAGRCWVLQKNQPFPRLHDHHVLSFGTIPPLDSCRQRNVFRLDSTSAHNPLHYKRSSIIGAPTCQVNLLLVPAICSAAFTSDGLAADTRCRRPSSGHSSSSSSSSSSRQQ